MLNVDWQAVVRTALGVLLPALARRLYNWCQGRSKPVIVAIIVIVVVTRPAR